MAVKQPCHWCSGTGVDAEQCSDGYHGGGTCPACEGSGREAPVAPAADDERAKNEAVALMILRNDRAGAVQWAKGLVLKDGKVEAEVAPAVPAAQDLGEQK